ncbi:MAG: NAD(P)-dependent oxidoreductase [Actinomycetia bacterium]|nr:NAD(P)-dependent oxidoreductase [Actinomycetes bacterium]
MHIAVLGTGIMGAGMAHSLLRAGHDVRVWNRTPGKTKGLASDGATIATSAGDAVRGSDAVLLSVFDTDAVLDVLETAAPDVGDAVVLQTATIGVDGSRRVAEAAARHGVTVLDAPVLGTKQPAENGALVPLVSGDSAAMDRVAPVLDAIGAKTIRSGDRFGDASALKLVCNAWVATLTGALAQSIAMAERLGLDPQLFLDSIAGGATDTPYAHVKGAAMIDGAYPTSFSVDGVVKDVGLMRDAAQETGLPDDILAAVVRLFQSTADLGHGDNDMAAVRAAFDI